MGKKRYSLVLLFIIVLVIFIYSIVLFIEDYNYRRFSENNDTSLYQYLTAVKNNPDYYMLVLGKNAEDYEIKYGEKIAEYFNIKVKYEDTVQLRENLILFGNPNTNSLLDKALTEKYRPNKAMLNLAGKNLVVVVNNEEEASGIYHNLANFKEMRYKLIPKTATFRFDHLVLYSILIALILVPLILLDYEFVRRTKANHKLNIVEGYVRKYRLEKYSDEQIVNGLVRYGYDENLVRKAVKNA